MKRGTLGKLAVVAAVGGAAFEIERRRLVRMRDRDPAWHELNQRLEGRSLEATSADGTRLHVEVFGSDGAPTIVFIHGWLETIRLWHHQIRDLSRDFRIVAYDQRGHGESDAPRGEAYTDEALSDDLQAVLDACVPHNTQCLVAGHSMGGMTIVAWAGRHPSQVQRLTVPTLVIGGELDLLLPIWHSEALAATLPKLVDYAELPGVGHMAMLEAPEEVTPRIGRLARACLMATVPPIRSEAASA